MGTLIRFPERVQGMRMAAADTGSGEPATVIILPVIRIERYDEEPAADLAPGAPAPARPGRRRRGRASR